MPAAINPYSMAVAPDSSPAKRFTRLVIRSSCSVAVCPGSRPECFCLPVTEPAPF
jgi:hypothetical protein